MRKIILIDINIPVLTGFRESFSASIFFIGAGLTISSLTPLTLVDAIDGVNLVLVAPPNVVLDVPNDASTFVGEVDIFVGDADKFVGDVDIFLKLVLFV